MIEQHDLSSPALCLVHQNVTRMRIRVNVTGNQDNQQCDSTKLQSDSPIEKDHVGVERPELVRHVHWVDFVLFHVLEVCHLTSLAVFHHQNAVSRQFPVNFRNSQPFHILEVCSHLKVNKTRFPLVEHSSLRHVSPSPCFFLREGSQARWADSSWTLRQATEI